MHPTTPAQFQPDLAPIMDNLTISALVALLPLLVIFVGLGVLKWKAHWAGLAAVAAAIVVAIFFWEMPAGLALLAASEGAVFGLFPISWIVFNAIVLYQLTVRSGHFEDLRATFRIISDDPRVQAIIIAFCFGALLEALAGFGAPVAITGVMLMAVGFSPLKAAAVVLLANTAPVAFGALAIPIITAGNLTGIPYEEIGAYVGHQAPVIAVFVPLLLVLMVDGRRGVRQTWPVALVVGIAFAVAQWVSATWISVAMTDIIASLVAMGTAVLFLRVWQPTGREQAMESLEAEREKEFATLGGGSEDSTSGSGGEHHVSPEDLDRQAAALTPRAIAWSLFPYVLVVVVFALAKLVPPIENLLVATNVAIPWPGLAGEVLTVDGEVAGSATYTFAWLSSPGSLLLICAVIVALVYGVGFSGLFADIKENAIRMRFAFLTIASVLALAYVMNLSGQTITIGAWIAGTGAAFAFFSPLLGWIGTAVTGSDTSANALFATLQQSAAQRAGIDPTLLVSANTAGGVVGKMISPQNLTIAATAVGLVGQEGTIFRKVLPWSVGLIIVMCLLVGLQSTPVLSWMLP